MQQVPDDKLIALAADLAVRGQSVVNPGFEMELNRRLKDAVEKLTAETIASRESSAQLIRQLDASISGLTAETAKAARASDRAARRLVLLTVVLVVLTGVLVYLTALLAARR